jgi:Spy/CpxP family protein refolding chaperone
MRTFWKWALALAVPASCVAAAEPAEPVVAEGTTVQLLLLRQKSVQEELKVSPEDAKKIAEFTTKESEEYRKALKLSEKDRQAKVEELEKENKKFLADNLSEAQRKRLGQIALQVSGLQQLTRPEVARLLNLTEEQQKKFKEMRVEARKELAELISSKDREGRNEKLAKLREAVDKKIEAVLTDEQKAKAKELVGEPFKGKLVFEEGE